MTRLPRSMGVIWVGALILSGLLFGTWAWSAEDARAGRGAEPVHGDAPPRIYRQVHAICVGIDRYKSAGIARLKWAEADANAVADMFEKRYGYQVQRLIGSRATRSAILDALKAYKQTLGPNDALVIFFAGHGQTIELDSYGRAGFLLPFDALLDLNDKRNTKDWEEAAIDMREIGKTLEAMPARHVLMLADACYSGFLGRRSAFGQRVDLQELMRRPSRMVITAGTEEQQAIEVDQLQHGVFTHFLLEQLDNPWPSSATEVFVSLRNGVANKTDGKMLPQLREIVIENGEFVFLPKEIGDGDVAGVIKDVNRRINDRVARRTEVANVIETFEAPDYRYAVDAPEQKSRWEEKLKRFQDNASLGDPLAMAGLHYCYSRGLGVEPDPTRAYDWARRAFDSQHVAGKHVLGRCYSNGIGVPKNVSAGWKLITEAAEGGFSISKFSVARREVDRLSQQWASSDPDSRKRQPLDPRLLQFLTKASEEGVATATFTLGSICAGAEDYLAVDADVPKGIEMMRSAAELGHAQAQYGMFFAYVVGRPGWPKPDMKTAGEWLQRAADRGWAEAQDSLARAYYQKRGYDLQVGLPQDFAQARHWAELAADQGHSRAHLLLTVLYENGDGVPQDYDKAREHCEKAAAGGLSAAISLQGVWYFDGTVYPRDDAKAFQKFTQAAKMGDAVGCYLLGLCYETARGMPLDGLAPIDVKPLLKYHALHWYTQAAVKGFEKATEKLREFYRDVRGQSNRVQDRLKQEYPKSAEQFEKLMSGEKGETKQGGKGRGDAGRDGDEEPEPGTSTQTPQIRGDSSLERFPRRPTFDAILPSYDLWLGGEEEWRDD